MAGGAMSLKKKNQSSHSFKIQEKNYFAAGAEVGRFQTSTKAQHGKQPREQNCTKGERLIVTQKGENGKKRRKKKKTFKRCLSLEPLDFQFQLLSFFISLFISPSHLFISLSHLISQLSHLFISLFISPCQLSQLLSQHLCAFCHVFRKKKKGNETGGIFGNRYGLISVFII